MSNPPTPPIITAAELFAVVERLPRKWWPKGVQWIDNDEENVDECLVGGGWAVDIDHGIHQAAICWPWIVYNIFVGHLLQELIGEGYHRFEWDSGETDLIDPSLSLCNHGEPLFGKSILEHLVAAALCADEDSHAN